LIQPKTSRNEIVGPRNGELIIRLTAPPVDGAANQALIKLLSKTFKIAKTRIQILSGETSRHKLLQLDSPSTIPASAEISAN